MTGQTADRPRSARSAVDLVVMLAAAGGVVLSLVVAWMLFLTAAFSDSANGLAGASGWFVLAWLLGVGLPVTCLVTGARGLRRRVGAAHGWAIATLVVGIAATAIGGLVVGGVTLALLPTAFAPAAVPALVVGLP